MKKLLLIIMIMLGVYAAQSQATIGFGKHTISNTLIITGSDTTIYRYIFSEGQAYSWSSTVSWASVVGAGTVDHQTSSEGTIFFDYSGLTQVAVTGATGNSGKSDGLCEWNILAIKITKGTISAGTLTWVLTIKKQ